MPHFVAETQPKAAKSQLLGLIFTPFAAILVLFCASASAADAEKITANWIWADTASNNQTVYFRKTIDLPAAPKTATLGITCDNHFELFINGEKSAKSDAWESPVLVNAAGKLKAGKKYHRRAWREPG